jgi:UDP-2,4-diacetamido-2,4,6-trideoxy-beta-L-altropyranose hydrolase
MNFREMLMRIAIRVDSSISIGLGHFMRCLALAQAWQEKGGKAKFILADKVPAIEEWLKAERMETAIVAARPGSLEDAKMTMAIAKENNAEWIVLDGYHFGAEYQKAIKDAGYRLLCIDDYGHATHYYADLVLNQNISAGASLYMNREPYTRLLLGTQYALLRKEFWPWRGWKRGIPVVAKKLLVTLGGGDPDNVTLQVIQALEIMDVEGLEGIIVIGGTNPSLEIIRDAARNSRHNLRIEYNVKNMPELMAWADMAISAGGSTCWELAFMALPSLIMVLADNQFAVAKTLHDHGLSINIGWRKDVSMPDIAKALRDLIKDNANRKEMAKIAKSCVDGKGSERIVNVLHYEGLFLRKAIIEDCELLWKWVNDPDVRKSAFRSDYIEIGEHEKWFFQKLKDHNCIQFIAFNRFNIPIGQIRFDIKDGEADIDVSVDKNIRGLGYGTYLIRKGIDSVGQLEKIKVFRAYIKSDNQASIQSFAQADFKNKGTQLIKGHHAVHLIHYNQDL